MVLEDFASKVNGTVIHENRRSLFRSRTVAQAVDLVCDGIRGRLERGASLSFELPEIFFTCLIQTAGPIQRDPVTGEEYAAPDRKSWRQPQEGFEYAEIGGDEFNNAFALQTNDADKARKFFNPRLQHELLAFNDWVNESLDDTFWCLNVSESGMQVILEINCEDLEQLVAFYHHSRPLLAAARG
jgi:hypothetical protein